MSKDKIEISETQLKKSTKIKSLKDNALVELKERIIDNPGKGNCGFYAFAIGLIDIIQEERVYNCTRMFDRWVCLDDALKGYYQDICKYDFDKPNYELLETLQRILRVIVFNSQLEEVRKACSAAKKEDEYKVLVATSAYSQFAELYYGTDVDPLFNDFAKYPEITTALAKIDPSSVKEHHEALVLAPLFMSLLYGEGVASESITEMTEPSKKSPILRALQNITEDFVWAGHLALDYLANAFQVNLHTLENGVAKYPFKDMLDRHTITVNNQYNIHWTTKVTLAHMSRPKESLDSDYKKAAERELVAPVKKVSEERGAPGEKVPDDHSEKLPPKDKNLKENPELHLQKTNSERSIKKTANPPPCSVSLECLNIDLFHNKFINAVNRAVVSYCDYSDSIWFSFFHRHGASGRSRARAFNKAFSETENLAQAGEILLAYLKDKKNGNTYPHSFRTMLLHELLLTRFQKAIDLKIISENYEKFLAQCEKKLLVPQNTDIVASSLS